MCLLLLLGTSMHARTARRMDEHPKIAIKSISLDDINPEAKGCGHWKCFFLSKTNPNRGYQLMRNGDIEHYRKPKPEKKHRDSRTFEIFADRFHFAECVKKEYGINHVVGFPRVAELTEEIVNEMEFSAKALHPSVVKPFLPGKIFVLPVHYSKNVVQFHIPGVYADLEEHMHKYMPVNPEYYDNFIGEMHKLDRVISEKVECLSSDFQGFVYENGMFSLFDVDNCLNPRCTERPPKDELEVLATLIKPLQKTLIKLMQLATAVKDEHFPAEQIRYRKLKSNYSTPRDTH